jgi:hypothetical protein
LPGLPCPKCFPSSETFSVPQTGLCPWRPRRPLQEG